jgi:hypothetical protein
MRYNFLVISFLIVSTFSAHAEITKNLRWKIKNTSWDYYYEESYQKFVHTMGVARKNGFCKTIDDCLKSPYANPEYSGLNPPRLDRFFSDCADLPYVLRAYFSWMNDLPFGYVTEVVAAGSFSRSKKDIRYSKFGNIITEKKYIKNGDNFNDVLQNVIDSVSTAVYRTNAEEFDSGNLFRDTYPVDINRDAIVPGTLFYDHNGHVAVVYDVTTNGKILLVDAHPDNSLSVITFGEKFERSSIKIGGGFANFRPFSVSGNWVTPRTNEELPNYSLIQYQKEPFIFKGQLLSFYDYVRNKLADGDIIYNPILEFNDKMDELCLDVKYRAEAVNTSLHAGLQNQTHPILLPDNIYGADGDWETYATPARDARLKESIREIKKYLTKIIQGNVKTDYSGKDIVTDLRNIYLSKTKSCSVMATPKTLLNLDFVLHHIFDISFDPYHCAELRWGLGNTYDCNADENKMRWYNAEQGLRNRIDRDNTIKTSYDVETLPKSPVSQVEKIDLSFEKLLEISP